MMAVLKMEKEKDMELLIIKKRNMKEIIKMIKKVDKANIILKMEIFGKVFGQMDYLFKEYVNTMTV